MFFHKKEKKDDLGEIKQAIKETDEPHKQSNSQSSSNQHTVQVSKIPQMQKSEKSENMDIGDVAFTDFKEGEEIPTNVGHEAPLFVKLDTYKEIINNISEMKVFSSNVKHLFTVLHEADSVRADAISVLRATIQRIERNLVEIDANLLRPHGIDLEEYEQVDVDMKHIESTLFDLQRQIGMIRQELHDLK